KCQSILAGQFRIRDPSEVPFSKEQGPLLRAIKVRAVERAGQIGHEHPSAFEVQCHADSFHQVTKENFRLYTLSWRRIHRRPVYGITARRVATISPVDHPISGIERQI